jgi:hypothetical protein
METDPFHPSKWLGNSTKGAFLDIGLKGSRNRQSLRGFVRIEPVVSLKSGFPLTHVAARYTSTIPEHWSSEGVLVDESPGHTLSIRFTFETPEGSASWLIFYGPYRPAKASEWHPEAPKSLVEAARVTKRHFESLFGQARLNPRRNPEGERHTSLKEQAESALLWERIRNAKSQKEALAHYRAALLAAENEQRLLRDRKKAGKGRKPKALYTKEYLAEKGTKRRNPPLSQQQQRKLMQALESDARSLSDIGNRPVGAMQFALFDENGNRMINWTYDMVGGSQEEPVLGMRPHPMWVIAPYAVGDEFDSMGYRYRVTAPNRAIRFARIRPKYYWDREGEQVLIPLGPPMKKNGRGR